MIDQNDLKSIVPVHHFNPTPFHCIFFLTITLHCGHRLVSEHQICAELSRLQHQRAGPECISFYCGKGQHLERGESFCHSWGEGREGILGKEKRRRGRGRGPCPGMERCNTSRLNSRNTLVYKKIYIEREGPICGNSS